MKRGTDKRDPSGSKRKRNGEQTLCETDEIGEDNAENVRKDPKVRGKTRVPEGTATEEMTAEHEDLSKVLKPIIESSIAAIMNAIKSASKMNNTTENELITMNESVTTNESVETNELVTTNPSNSTDRTNKINEEVDTGNEKENSVNSVSTDQQKVVLNANTVTQVATEESVAKLVQEEVQKFFMKTTVPAAGSALWEQPRTPTFQVPKYKLHDGTLFRTWKNTLFDELVLMGLGDVVDEKIPIPSNIRNPAERRVYVGKLIKFRLDKEHADHVAGIDEPKEILRRLEEKRDPSTAVKKMSLIKELYNLNYDRAAVTAQKFNEYFNELKTKLRRHDEKRWTDEEELKEAYVAAVRRAYPNIATQTGIRPMSLAQLQQLLIEEEANRLEDEDRAGQGPPKALSARGRDRGRGRGRGGSRGRWDVRGVGQNDEPRKDQKSVCYNCGRAGHYASECDAEDGVKKCYSCNKMTSTHVGYNCPTRGMRGGRGNRGICGPQNKHGGHGYGNKNSSQSKLKTALKRALNKKLTSKAAFAELQDEDWDEILNEVEEENTAEQDEIVMYARYREEEDDEDKSNGRSVAFTASNNDDGTVQML